jgi:hypothetical protein
MPEDASGFGERYGVLIDVISRCSKVRELDRSDEPEASTLAHAFLDLEESFRRFIDEHLPELSRSDLSEQQVCDRLHEIGEELRHVLYHIRDPRFYDYLFANDREMFR